MDDNQAKMSEDPSGTTHVEAEKQHSESTPDELRKEIEAQFNIQRARMKELFLQKEDELRKVTREKQELEVELVGLKTQFQQLSMLSENQNTELQNLQLVVTETLEDSSATLAEAKWLRARNVDLEKQVEMLKHKAQQHHQEMSITSGILVRSLTRKLTADSEDTTDKKTTEEDELSRSNNHPREVEIAALKSKLRETDGQLQEALAALKNPTRASTALGDGQAESEQNKACDMCLNYEKQLVDEQQKSEASREKAVRLEQALRLATEELEGVRSLHDETVRAWRSDRENTTQRIEELSISVQEAKRTLESVVEDSLRASQGALERVTMLTVDRETLQRKLDSLERDNARLIGEYTKRAAEMQNELINLPSNFNDLQEYTLQLREQLIVCQIGRETALETERELRNQLLEQSSEFHRQEHVLNDVHEKYQKTREELEQLQTEREQMQQLADRLRHSTAHIEQLLSDKKRLESETVELRNRVLVLQQELDNSEKVQQDFVRLSQSLQIQLQRIREADTEVRWQHEDDVNECPSCRTALLNNKKKVHCRHCGRIFCGSCCNHTVASGPRGVAARVCSVCKTLLQPHAAPYFSTDPPRDPD